MAIEIKELNVTLQLGKNGGGSSGNSKSGCDDCGEMPSHDRVVEDAVKEVLRIIKAQKER